MELKPQDVLPYRLNDVLKLLGQKRLCEACFEFPAMKDSPYCEGCREEMEVSFKEVDRLDAKRDEEREREIDFEGHLRHTKKHKSNK
jgi:hypothetical protein